jgi:translation initiation factor IF-3
MAHTGLGADVLKRFVESIPEAVIEAEPKMMGRGMTMVVSKSKSTQTPKEKIKDIKE